LQRLVPEETSEGAHFDETQWEQLREAARNARDLAYAPYSRHPVGAAALTDDGRIVTGSNVENASLGVTLCAECSMVGDLVRTGKPGERGKLVAFACVGPNPGALLPCGRCRQLLFEHGGPDLLIDRNGGPVPLSFLLPDAFSGDDLP
jgi:cytidine deaminase